MSQCFSESPTRILFFCAYILLNWFPGNWQEKKHTVFKNELSFLFDIVLIETFDVYINFRCKQQHISALFLSSHKSLDFAMISGSQTASINQHSCDQSSSSSKTVSHKLKCFALKISLEKQGAAEKVFVVESLCPHALCFCPNN